MEEFCFYLMTVAGFSVACALVKAGVCWLCRAYNAKLADEAERQARADYHDTDDI